MSKPLEDYTLYFDGSCKVNPGGPGGWGFYVLDGRGVRIAEGMGAMHPAKWVTNNVLEWKALLAGIRWLQFQQTVTINSLLVRGDSDLVIRQARGEWKCKKPHLKEYRRQLVLMIEAMDIGELKFEWIPREQNTHADDLSNRAYSFA